MIRRHGLALAICAGLAICHTWPLAANPATHSRIDTADGLLNMWILGWIAHQLPRDPLHLFDANIFYPTRDVLALSEPLIVPGAMGAPAAWLDASPVLVYNLVALAGLILTAFATWRLIESWTGDRVAAALAAGAFAFNAHTLTRLAHVQGLHLYGLPLALLASDRLLTHARTRDALWLALWMTLPVYTSGHTAVFAIVMVGTIVIARARAWWGPRAVPVLGRFVLAAAVAGVASLPVYLPYKRVADTQGMVRSLDAVTTYSATWKQYVAATGRLHTSTWSLPYFVGDSYAPGFLVLALAAASLWFAARRRQGLPADGIAPEAVEAPSLQLTRARIGMLLAIAIVGVVLSLGTHTPIYGWVFEVFPPIRGIRAASRFGTLFILSMACLAGFGVWMLRARLGALRWAPAAAVALVALANAETLMAPIAYRRFEGIPEIYTRLADEPGHVVLLRSEEHTSELQ